MENLSNRLKSANRGVLIGGVLVAVLIIGAVVVLATNIRPPAQTFGGAEPVKSFTGDLSESVTASGQLLPMRDAMLSMSVPGIVTAVNVKVGDKVTEGTALIQLDDTIAKQNVAKAETALKLAQVKVDTAQHDFQTRANWSPNGFQVNAAVDQMQNAAAAVQATQAQYDKVAYLPFVSSTPQSQALQTATNNFNMAQANLNYLVTNRPDLAIAQDNLNAALLGLNAAQIDLDTANRTLDKLTLLAPFDGTITAVNVEVGESATGPVAEISTMDQLDVIMDIDEMDVGALKVGQPAALTFDAYPGVAVSGKVTSIAPKANSTANVVNFEVHLGVDKTDLDLRAGMTVNAVIQTVSLTKVLLVPNEAVRQDDSGKYFVMVVTPNGSQKTEVTIGARNHSYTQIMSGIKDGDELELNSAPLSAAP